MNWLFETSIFTSKLNCGYLDTWMYPVSLLSNLAYIFVYTLMPIALVVFHMYRGYNFAFPKWATSIIVLFMFVTCLNRLNYLASYRWPAYRFFIVVEAFGGIISILVGFLLPYLVKIAADAPTTHKMKNLENEVSLYKKLDEVLQSQVKLTTDAVIHRIERNVDKKTLDDVQAILNTLAQR